MKDARILLGGLDGALTAELRHLLTSAGHEVLAVAATAAEAQRLARDLQPDVVLLDVRLPAAATEALRSRWPSPVVWFGRDRDAAASPEAPGPIPLLTPPFAAAPLCAAVALALSHHRAERRWTATLDALGAVVVTDPGGYISSLNAAAESLTGWPRTEAAGRPLLQTISLLDEQTRRPFEDPVPQAVAGVTEALPPRHALLIARDGREVPVQLEAAALREGGGDPPQPAGAVLVLRDVTEPRRLEEQVRLTQRLETVGRLAGGIAHDFNNLLTVVNGYSSLLLSTLETDHAWHAPLAEIHRAGERAAELTRQLLAFSCRQVLQARVLDLNEVVAASAAALAGVVGPRVKVVTVLDPRLPPVTLDARQVDQILLDLARNACDAMPGGGTLTLETARVVLTQGEARARPGFRAGPCARLRVGDTGAGMDAEVRRRAFEPFFTTKPPGQGSGMGLASVYGTVRQSGGHIEVASAPGRGTTFTMDFPQAADAEAPPGLAAVPPDLPRGVETVLVIDDEPAVRELNVQILRMCGYTVLAAAGGPEALHVVGRHNAPLHLVVAEETLVSAKGDEVWAFLAARHPGVRLLLLSDYPEEEVLPPPGVAVLQKPYLPRELARKVRAALDGPAPGGAAAAPASRGR